MLGLSHSHASFTQVSLAFSQVPEHTPVHPSLVPHALPVQLGVQVQAPFVHGPDEHVSHVAPLVPHALVEVPSSHASPLQHPEHEVSSQVHTPDRQCCPDAQLVVVQPPVVASGEGPVPPPASPPPPFPASRPPPVLASRPPLTPPPASCPPPMSASYAPLVPPPWHVHGSQVPSAPQTRSPSPPVPHRQIAIALAVHSVVDDVLPHPATIASAAPATAPARLRPATVSG